MTPSDYAEIAKRDGAVLVPGYVRDVANIEATLERLHPNDRLPVLLGVRGQVAIHSLAIALTGSSMPVDTGEHVVNINNTDPAYTDWHRDDPHGDTDLLMPAWRFGIYFRDYREHSGGVAVMVGSHLVNPRQPFTGKPMYMSSQPGDLVIWNLRTLHKAGADFNGKPVAEGPRNTMFFDYAAPHPDVALYKAWRTSMLLRRGIVR